MTGAAGGMAWLRGGFRRRWFALQTALGFAERGFFIPYRYAGEQGAPPRRCAYPAIEALFQARQDRFDAVLKQLDGFATDLTAIGHASAPAPRWTQDWFPRLDAAIAYAMVRQLAPTRVVEVGSGHSTRFLLQAVIDADLATEITSIDPAPRARLAVQDLRLRVVASTLQQAGESAFAELGAGDIVSVDSSHILMPGSDVDFMFGRVLPFLPADSYLHLHDIFLPDDYPSAWSWRGYNEQIAVAALLSGDAWEPVFSSHYAVSRMTRSVASSCVAHLPLAAGAYESSLWLRRRTGSGRATSQGNERG